MGSNAVFVLFLFASQLVSGSFSAFVSFKLLWVVVLPLLTLHGGAV